MTRSLSKKFVEGAEKIAHTLVQTIVVCRAIYGATCFDLTSAKLENLESCSSSRKWLASVLFQFTIHSSGHAKEWPKNDV